MKTPNQPKVTVHRPSVLAFIYVVGAVLAIPWTSYLGYSLPTHHLFKHWDIAWVGLDIAILVSMLSTGILAFKKSLWVVIGASVTGTLLTLDAWFDLNGAQPGHELLQATGAATLIEIPLAILSFRLAYKTLVRAYLKKGTL